MAVLLVAGLVAALAVVGFGDAGTASFFLVGVVGLIVATAAAAIALHARARRQLVWATPLDGLPQLWDEHDEGTIAGPRRSPRHAA